MKDSNQMSKRTMQATAFLIAACVALIGFAQARRVYHGQVGAPITVSDSNQYAPGENRPDFPFDIESSSQTTTGKTVNHATTTTTLPPTENTATTTTTLPTTPSESTSVTAASSTTPADTVTTASLKASAPQVEIKVSPVNLRSGPGHAYSKIGSVSKGDRFAYLDAKTDEDGAVWYQIRLSDSETAWVINKCAVLHNASTTAASTKKTTTASVKGASTTKESATSKTTTTKKATTTTKKATTTTKKATTTTKKATTTTKKATTTTKKTTTTTKKTTTTTTTKKTTTTTTTAAAVPQTTDSASPYYIIVYKGSQSTVVYSKDDNGKYTKTAKTFTCSTGKSSSPTRIGTYHIRAKYRWRYLVGGVYGQFSSSISSSYLFHSVPYYRQDPSTLENEEYDKLGTPASKGCIRMCVRDCKWIYDNCPIGTEVKIVNDSGPSGPGVPGRDSASRFSGWDPSDRWADGNPYFA